MAQLASLASLIGAGASVYGSVRAAQEQGKASKAQNDAIRTQQAERTRQLSVQSDADRRARQETLARTLASVRARLASGGLRPDEGSAAALTAGLRSDAEADQADQNALFDSRLAAGRRSLLNPDGTLTAFLRSGQTIGTAFRNLLA